jgi:hypothetical protein
MAIRVTQVENLESPRNLAKFGEGSLKAPLNCIFGIFPLAKYAEYLVIDLYSMPLVQLPESCGASRLGLGDKPPIVARFTLRVHPPPCNQWDFFNIHKFRVPPTSVG